MARDRVDLIAPRLETGQFGLTTLNSDREANMEVRGTTILAVRRGGVVAMGGDGQVTLGQSMVIKGTARKIRRIGRGEVLTGIAGSTADAFALLETFERIHDRFRSDLRRSAIEFSKQWRRDRFLRRLDAAMLVADVTAQFMIMGSGDVLSPDHDVVAIGSGAPFALSAARALREHTEMAPVDIVQKSMSIAADSCVFTNHNIAIEELNGPQLVTGEGN